MKRNELCLLRQVGETYYLENSNGNELNMVFLNETSAFLWKKMVDCETAEKLIQEFINEYDVDINTATKDVSAFLAFLLKNGCIELDE